MKRVMALWKKSNQAAAFPVAALVLLDGRAVNVWGLRSMTIGLLFIFSCRTTGYFFCFVLSTCSITGAFGASIIAILCAVCGVDRAGKVFTADGAGGS